MRYLESLRKKLRFQSQEMAANLKVSKQFYSSVEKGKYKINTDMLLGIKKLCDKYGEKFEFEKIIENKEV